MIDELDRVVGPTPERLRIAGDQVEVFTPDKNTDWKAIRLLDGHQLESLLSRGNISGELFGAGMRYYADWYLGGMSDSGVIDPGLIIVDGGKIDHMSDNRLAALNRYQIACKALCREHADVMHYVVLHEMPIAEYGRKVFGHKHDKLSSLATRTRLHDALTNLDRHYYGKRTQHHRSAGAPGYRPRILSEIEREEG